VRGESRGMETEVARRAKAKVRRRKRTKERKGK
jgi:hypothetical protein